MRCMALADFRPAGLSSAEARERLVRDGPNRLGTQDRRAWLDTLRDLLLEPMFLLLLAAGALYLVLGERADALVLMAAVIVVIGITFVQERRTEHALDALRELASPRALVMRDGVAQRIAAHALVVGDAVLLAEGDRVPADALLREAAHLSVDESLLSGESVPVDKRADPNANTLGVPGSDITSSTSASLFAGTLVVAGHGLCEVMRTGARSEFGRIGMALQTIAQEPTPLMRQMRRAVRWMATFGLLACALVVTAYALTRGADLRAWRDGGLAGIAMAMGLLPEEFPVVLTVFLALGAWRLSRQQVLTRRLPAIETLGAASVLCVDKTGTLTRNRIAVAALLPFEAAGVDTAALLVAARRASRAQATDPIDRALHEHGKPEGATREEPGSWQWWHEYPITAQRMAVVQLWREGARWLAAAKGAPEAVAALCRLDAHAWQAVQPMLHDLAARGLRVLAVAQAGDPCGASNARPSDALITPPVDPVDLSLQWLGLVAFADPLRDDVPQAVQACAQAGIRVVMITGDHPATAQAIAQQAGIDGASATMTGTELDRLDDAALARRIDAVRVFARVVPQQKLRIVQALKARGAVVAMTGDGVNDAPALKAAHIGVAMGARGSDVAREAASLVLLDDAFGSIVEAVRQGRRIRANLRRAVVFIVAVHVPLAGLSVLPVFTPGSPLWLLPVHVALLELIIDPTCALVFEAEPAEPSVMREPPPGANASLFTPGTVVMALLQGLSVLGACVLVQRLAADVHTVDAVRGLTLATLIVGVLTLIVANRSQRGVADAWRWHRNPALWMVLAGTLTVLAIMLGVPGLAPLFRVAPLHPGDLVLSLAAGVLCLLWVWPLRWLQRRA